LIDAPRSSTLFVHLVFRVIEIGPDGKLEVRENVKDASLPPPGTLRWVDVAGEGESLDRLRSEFAFHPLAVEDCRQFNQRPKLEEYRDHLFLVTQGFSLDGSEERADEKAPSAADGARKAAATEEREEEVQGFKLHGLHLHELHAFLGKDYLVTVHADEIPALEEIWMRVTADQTLLERGVDFVYYLTAARLVEANQPILDHITDELEDLEDRVLSAPAREDLARIFELKRRLVLMRKVLSPQRDTMAMLGRRGDPRVSERTSHYFRDVHDQLVRLNESIEANRDLLGNALDAYLSAVSNRTNEIMKYLTLLSAVFLPLAFIVGFFGQNFANLPGVPNWQASDMLMRVMLGLCILTPVVMLTWFRLRHWI
jgi:magnesium transporter